MVLVAETPAVEEASIVIVEEEEVSATQTSEVNAPVAILADSATVVVEEAAEETAVLAQEASVTAAVVVVVEVIAEVIAEVEAEVSATPTKKESAPVEILAVSAMLKHRSMSCALLHRLLFHSSQAEK
jgi:hypothetical protein